MAHVWCVVLLLSFFASPVLALTPTPTPTPIPLSVDELVGRYDVTILSSQSGEVLEGEVSEGRQSGLGITITFSRGRLLSLHGELATGGSIDLEGRRFEFDFVMEASGSAVASKEDGVPHIVGTVLVNPGPLPETISFDMVMTASGGGGGGGGGCSTTPRRRPLSLAMLLLVPASLRALATLRARRRKLY